MGASGWVAGYVRLFLDGLGLVVVLDYFSWVGWLGLVVFWGFGGFLDLTLWVLVCRVFVSLTCLGDIACGSGRLVGSLLG